MNKSKTSPGPGRGCREGARTNVTYPGVEPRFCLSGAPWIGGQKIPPWAVSTQGFHRQHMRLHLRTCVIPCGKHRGPVLKSCETPWKASGTGTVFHV